MGGTEGGDKKGRASSVVQQLQKQKEEDETVLAPPSQPMHTGNSTTTNNVKKQLTRGAGPPSSPQASPRGKPYVLGKERVGRITTASSTSSGSAQSPPSSEEHSGGAGAGLNPMFVLAHFCEMHGPSVLLCTQLISAPWLSSSTATPPSSSSSSRHSPSAEEGSLPRREGASCWSPHGASVLSPRGTSTPSPWSSVTVHVSGVADGGRGSTAVCPSCHVLPSDSGFFSVSENSEDGAYFITTRYPSASYARIRTACVRALSCEFSPGGEGPMFFGDEENGFCLSYVFKVHDLLARGFVRWYGVLFLAPHASLLASMDFVVGSIEGIAKDLESQSASIFAKEKEERDRQAQARSSEPRASLPANQALHTLRSRLSFPTGPGAFRRRQIHANAPLRGLDALIGDKGLPAKLHSSFAWILQHWERQHLISVLKPFEKLSQPLPKSTISPDLGGTNTSSTCSTGVIEQPEGPIEGENVLTFGSLKQLMHALGSSNFDALLYNVLCGNQVVVRGQCRPLVASVLLLLMELLPRRCATAKMWEMDVYHESWEFNFLGLSREVVIPTYVSPESYALVDIFPHRLSPAKMLEHSPTPPPPSPSSSLPILPLPLSVHCGATDLVLSSPRSLTPTTTTISPSDSTNTMTPSSMLSHLLDSSSGPTPFTVSPSPSPPCSPCSFNAWTSYRYDCQAHITGVRSTLQGEIMETLRLNLPDSVENQRLRMSKQVWRSKAKAFFMISKIMENETDIRLQVFMNATNMAEADLPVLRFWTTGLRHTPSFHEFLATRSKAVAIPRTTTFVGSLSSSFSRKPPASLAV